MALDHELDSDADLIPLDLGVDVYLDADCSAGDYDPIGSLEDTRRVLLDPLVPLVPLDPPPPPPPPLPRLRVERPRPDSGKVSRAALDDIFRRARSLHRPREAS